MAAILWKRSDGAGMDRCELEQVPGGWRLAGTALLLVDGGAHEIRYTVITDPLWQTRTVGVHVQTPGRDRRLALTADGSGSWETAGGPLIELFGAIDVDLAWTPATNTLPIRRLGLGIGESADIAVAHVAFPAHELHRVAQRYERVGEHTYRYTSSSTETLLRVNDDGLVVDDPSGWSAVGSEGRVQG